GAGGRGTTAARAAAVRCAMASCRATATKSSGCGWCCSSRAAEAEKGSRMSLQSSITGKAYVLGDNVDTDQIIPAQYLTLNPAIPEEYRQFGKFALSSVPPSQAALPKG